jgi:type I restriction enzyme M protein
MDRSSRLNYSFAPERIERLKATSAFQDIASSKKRGKERKKEIRIGKMIQDNIIILLDDMDGRRIYRDREEFRTMLESVFKGMMRFPPYFWDVMLDALSEQDETGEIGTDLEGNPEPDPERAV